jgi:hypothetical protein
MQWEVENPVLNGSLSLQNGDVASSGIVPNIEPPRKLRLFLGADNFFELSDC